MQIKSLVCLVTVQLGIFTSIIAPAAEAQTTATGEMALSWLDVSRAMQTWGRPRKDVSVGNKPLSIKGQRYLSGFGTHSFSRLFVRLDGKATEFNASVGVDDGAAAQGSVEFRVIGDGKLIWSSGIMRQGQAAKPMAVNVSGVQYLTLEVTDAGDGLASDHADWVDAKFKGLSGPIEVVERLPDDKDKIISGAAWRDTDGYPIQAHGGGILAYEGKYYWYGEDRSRGYVGIGVSGYVSDDLVTWKHLGLVLPKVAYDEKWKELTINERPKVVYNPRTKKFVMWFHWDRASYWDSRAGVAVADKPEGPFVYLGQHRPVEKSTYRDMNLFVDDDGRAYAIYAGEENYTMHIVRLNDEWTAPEMPMVEGKTWIRTLVRAHREAPALFKHNGKYYMITSAATGWDANAANYAVADSMLGDWKIMPNPFVGAASEITFGSQSTYVLPVPEKAGSFIYVGDRWNPSNLADARYVWLPFQMKPDGTFEIRWNDSWSPKDLPVGGPIVDPETAKATLLEKIKQGDKLEENKYSFVSWNELRFAMNSAREVANKAGATPTELGTATANVQQKIDGLKARAVQPALTPRIGFSASLFATDRKGPVNNVALMWGATEPQDSYEIYRASGKSANFTKIYSGQGSSFNDNNLKIGSYSYKLVAQRAGKTLTSKVQLVTTMAMPAGVKEYSNQTGEGGPLWEPLKVGKTYYRFPGKRDGKTVSFTVETSTDGKVWKQGPVVMDASSHADLDDFKLEANNIFYDQKHDRIVWWAHWERAQGYGSGRALVATAKPGERFTVHHVYNPLGVEVRDMSIFRDDDGQNYLIAASNLPGQGANATLYIFKLNDTFTDVTGITNKLMENGYREAPHIIRTGGDYYVFFSQAAGWFPSRAGYVTGKTLDGQWSEVRYVGNTSTFSAQSGGIDDYGHGKAYIPILMANRWIRGEGTSGNAVIPLNCNDGFALGDYAPTLLVDPNKDILIPLYAGTLLSQDKPATSSIAGSKDGEVGKAFDGDYNTAFRSDDRKWPFSVTTDLGVNAKVRNVQVSWHLHKGSEAYYKYTIEGSTNGTDWQTLLDRTDDKNTLVSKTYGFTSDLLPNAPIVRYVRINVQQAVLHNNPNNWYQPTLYEVKVYGDSVEK